MLEKQGRLLLFVVIINYYMKSQSGTHSHPYVMHNLWNLGGILGPQECSLAKRRAYFALVFASPLSASDP